jgi:general secretion pathway protein D
MIPLILAAPLLFMPAPLAQDDGQSPPPIQELNGEYILNFAQAENGEEGMTLARLVRACEQVTGITFTYTEETFTFLNSAQVRLIGTKTVPKDEFYNFFQILMVINEFVCTEIGADPISVIEITSLQTGQRNTIRKDSVFVEPEDLDRYSDQPATLITTVVSLPNTDVRQLSNSMRTMISDTNTQQMLPAGNTNSMVLVGFGSNVVALARMLNIVDEASAIEPVTPVFEVIPLEYAAADEIASTVEELLDASTRVVQQGQQRQPQGATAPISQGATEAKIMVDPRTNSLLVMAMPDVLPGIKELVARLDVDVIERERSYHIYNLENVSADDLAATLNDFLQDATRLEANRQTTGQGQRGGGATGSNNQTEFVVVPDEQTNSLLIAASRTRYQELKALIAHLDERQDQVLIETALVELSSRDFLDIGVELGLANIPGVGEAGGFGVTNFGLSTLSDTDDDGIPDTKVPNTANGITAGILDGDDFSLPVLLQLIEEKRNSNVLNVPSVLVNNNGSATVTTIEEQPTTTITATGGVSGQTQENFNGYEQAGITMQISPSISASRYLRMGIFLEVSNFIGVVSGAIPPTRITRTLETTVNVPDGDTMVIGGIIVDNRTQTETQIPFLGDIPVIGLLFERKASTLDRTALYFFVTPHIMSDDSFGDLADFSYRKKLEAANTIGFDRVRLIDEQFGKSAEEIGLSGFDVPLYTAPTRGETNGAEVDINPMDARDMLEEGRENAAGDDADSHDGASGEDTDREGEE